MTRILHAFPPNYGNIRRAFPWIKGRKGILYAHGETIYNPSNIDIPAWVVIHEEVHLLRQRAHGVDAWWEDYIADPGFRLREEVMAHRAEWRALPPHWNMRWKLEYLDMMTKRLAGPLYNHLLTPQEARELITQEEDPNAEPARELEP